MAFATKLFSILLMSISQYSMAASTYVPILEARSQQSILEELKNSKMCFYFLDGITKTKITKTLDSSKRYTFFVPTDQAFEQISLHITEALESNLHEYKRILSYHIVVGELIDELILSGQEVVTLEGSRVRIEIRDNIMYVNDTKVIGKALANSGSIYYLESILIP